MFEKIKDWVMNNKPLAIGAGLVVLVVIAFIAIRAKKKAAIRARLKKARAAKARQLNSMANIKRKPTASRESMAAKMARLRAMRGKKRKTQ